MELQISLDNYDLRGRITQNERTGNYEAEVSVWEQPEHGTRLSIGDGIGGTESEAFGNAVRRLLGDVHNSGNFPNKTATVAESFRESFHEAYQDRKRAERQAE